MDLLGRDQKIAVKAVLEDVEKLKKLYYNPKDPASFGGVKRLSYVSGLKTRVRKFLSGEDLYTLHFPVRYKFQRRKTIAYGVNELWQSDLVDLQKISRFNRCYPYLLTVIDVMSRYLRAFPIKDKKAGTIAKVFNKVFKEVRTKNIQTDKEELQKIDKSDNDLSAIEKIIRTKGRGTSRQLFLKWAGFDDSFNSWLKAEWLKT
ncbi:chromo domain-containing protein [Trichonephila clavipes]|nr:chromo domain-containing protein [Trichonephila clavipes]